MQVNYEKTYLKTAPTGLSQMDSPKEVKNDNASNQSGAVEMMNYLKENYKHINFSFVSFDNNSQIGQYGSTMMGKNNVAISSELLEKMSTDENVKNNVENILRHLSSYQKSAQSGAFLRDRELVSMGLVIDKDCKVSMWTATKEQDEESIYPTYWRDREPTDFYSKHVKKKNSSSNYNFSRSNNMMRLASAKNVPAVRGLIAAKYGEIQTVKAKVKDPVEAAAIVRKIKSVIQSGNIKISRLHKEENLALLKKSAEKKMKEKLARQLAEELRRKKIARKGQEYCQTAHLDDVMPKPSLDDERFRQIAEQYAESLSPAALAAETGTTVDAVAGGGSEAVSITVVAAPIASVAVDCMA